MLLKNYDALEKTAVDFVTVQSIYVVSCFAAILFCYCPLFAAKGENFSFNYYLFIFFSSFHLCINVIFYEHYYSLFRVVPLPLRCCTYF